MVRNNNHTVDDESDQDSDSADSIDFQHYIRVLRKYKWSILLFTALATLLAAFYAYTATPIYSSRATLLIEPQKPNLISMDELYTVDNGKNEYFDTQLQILKSRVLASRVVVKLGLVKGVTDGSKVPSLVSTTDGSRVEPQVKTTDSTKVATTAQSNNGAGNRPIDKVTKQLSSFIKGMRNGFDELKNKFGELKSKIVTLATGILNGSTSTPDNAPRNETEKVEKIVNDPVALAEKTKRRLEKRNERRIANKASQFLSNLTISPVRNTNLVKIRYDNANRDFAAEAANAVAEEYILMVVDSRMEIKSKASAWLYDRLGVLKEKLDIAESNLFRFKQENGLVDVNGSVERLNERELMLATTELASARIELSNADDLYREVSRLKVSAPILLESLPAIQNDALVRSVKIEFGQRQREFDELSNRYGDKHPKMVDAQSRLESLRTTLDGHIKRVLSSIEKEFQLRRQRVASIESTLTQGKENIQLIGQKKFRLDALEREVTSNRDLYNQFFNKISQTNSADGLDAANARISDFAIPANFPIKPMKQLIIALAALASLLLTVIMAFLYEKFDETIKSSHDVENKLGIRLLGILPLIKKGILSGNRKLPLNPLEIVDKKGSFTESVNTVQTELSIDDIGDERRKVILITSSVPGEGKSSSALNLAHAFSQIEKVLMIDCDMRRPSLAKALGESKNMPGLSNLITGSASPIECIRRNAIGTIDILPSGPIPNQPLALLSCARFEEILTQLRKYYDRIIIDSAPTQAVSDALILSKLVDNVVYVVKSHSTSFTQVKRGLARLSRIDAEIAGVLVTQVDMDKIASYGGDYYFQGYYDYYGYNDNAERSKKGTKKFRLTPEELLIMRNRNTAMDFEEFAISTGRNGYQTPVTTLDIEFDALPSVERSVRPTKRRSGESSRR